MATVKVRRGSTTITRGRFGPSLAARIRIQSTVLCSAALWPKRTMHSASSKSAKPPGGPSAPKLAISDAEVVAVQRRVLASIVARPSPPRAIFPRV